MITNRNNMDKAEEITHFSKCARDFKHFSRRTVGQLLHKQVKLSERRKMIFFPGRGSKLIFCPKLDHKIQCEFCRFDQIQLGLKVTFCHRWCRCNLGLIRDVSDGQSLAKEPFTRSWTIGGVLWQEAADAMLLSWQKITVVIKSWDQ